jgi:MoxR-like ATPase
MEPMDEKSIFLGTGVPHDRIDGLADPPYWRRFTEQARAERGTKFQVSEAERELVNAALYLRRPLLVTGKPGTGKSSLAYAVAHELGLGKVLLWSITTRSTLQQGLYSYDAIARMQATALSSQHQSKGEQAQAEKDETRAEAQDIGRYIRLGPLGTAFLPKQPAAQPAKPRPRVLLIDEIDKSDIDLPNDLLHIFEEGEFDIPELARLPDEENFRRIDVSPFDSDEKVSIERGKVRCHNFPFVVLTSNGEREFPPAFLRRCLRLEVKPHPPDVLAKIVQERLTPGEDDKTQVETLIAEFVKERDIEKRELATDQLLNAVYLAIQGIDPLKRELLRAAIFRSLNETQ